MRGLSQLTSAVLVAVLLTGCVPFTGEGNYSNGNGNNGSTATPGPTKPGTSTSTPAPTPTPTTTAPPDQHGHEDEPDEETVKAGQDFTKMFSALLSDRTMSAEAWRAAVVPYLYSEQLKTLYGSLDPYSIPFCTGVSSVELGGSNTFSAVYKVNFKDSTSYMAIEIQDVSQDLSVRDYKVLYIDARMNDNGGC